jgi:LmbE family N-acetylglucosaminyl deacetylase
VRPFRWIRAIAVVLAVGFVFLAFIGIAPAFNRARLSPEKAAQAKRVLAVLAHADDEVMSAGLLHHFAQSGARVHLLTLTDGAANPNSNLEVCEDLDIRDCRAREVRNAAKRIGIEELTLGMLPDSKLLEHVEEGALLVREAWKRLEPDTVLTVEPSGLNGNADHRAAHIIVMNALHQLEVTKNGPPDVRVYLTTLPFPLNLVLRSRMPKGGGVAMQHFLLDEAMVRVKTEVASLHASQAGTLQKMSWGLGPSVLFRWMSRESFWILEGSALPSFVEASVVQ